MACIYIIFVTVNTGSMYQLIQLGMSGKKGSQQLHIYCIRI